MKGSHARATDIRRGHCVVSGSKQLYCCDDTPSSTEFELMCVIRVKHEIDQYQKSYLVIENYEKLSEATKQDFTPSMIGKRQINIAEIVIISSPRTPYSGN